MATPLGPQGRVAGLALDIDFGHSPVGSLGGRTVQQVPAGPPRSLGQSFIAWAGAVADLGSRVLDAITPHGLRADSKVRAGLEATSQAVGDLVGALSKSKNHAVDGFQAQAILAALPQVAAPVTSRGASFGQVIEQRAAVHVKNMSSAQLVALQDGLQLAHQSALSAEPGGAAVLAVLGNAVKLELMQRLLAKAELGMRPVLEKCMAEVPRGPHAVAFTYNSLYGMALPLLADHGRADSRDLQRALIKDVMSRLVDDGTLDLGRTGEMIRLLPSRELRDLLDTATTLAPEPPFTCERLLTGSVGVRAEQSEQGFLQAAIQLLTHREPAVDDPHGPLHDPRGFARELVAASDHLLALRSHCEIHQLTMSPEVDVQLARLHGQLEELLRPSNLLLVELNHQQLFEMGRALERLGIYRGRTDIAEAIAQRKAESVDQYSQVLRGACDAAAAGDLGAMLQALEAAQTRGNAALQTHQKLGQRIDDTDKIMQFRGELVARALDGLDEAALGRLFASLQSVEVRALAGALADAGLALLPGQDSVNGRDPALGKRLFDAGIDLQMLDLCVGDALRAKGISLPPGPDSQTGYGLGDLGPRGQAALRQAYGVEPAPGLGVNIKVGMAGPDAQRLFEQNLRGIERGATLEFVLDGVGTGIADALWLDLPRAHYVVRGPRGDSHPVLDREALSRETTAERRGQMLAAVQQLREAAGSAPVLLMQLSRYANQNLLAGVQQALLSAHSPIRLPDGTPGNLMGPERISYNVASDGDGGLLLRCDYAVQNATHFMDPAAGTAVALDAARSHAHFTVELQIAAGGEVRVSDPLQFLYELVPLAGETQ